MTELDWLSPPDLFHLPDSEIHIWRATIPNQLINIDEHTSILSFEEKERAARFHDQIDASRFIWQHATLRRVLSQYLKLQPQEIMFKYSPLGKPALITALNPHELSFNISHSGQIMLIALTSGRQVGIDVEMARPIDDMNRMVELYFSPSEIEWYMALPESERQLAFFSAWTRKEAFLKAIGEGLQYPPEQVEVSMDPDAVAPSLNLLDDSQPDLGYRLLSFQPAEGYIAALAAEGRNWSVQAFHFI
jgi:4'-phosphopantetheinyl transferase